MTFRHEDTMQHAALLEIKGGWREGGREGYGWKGAPRVKNAFLLQQEGAIPVYWGGVAVSDTEAGSPLTLRL